ncbi:hypothetical protein A0H81_01147 [Grifola frondosa]|uniref:BZIP domain-containing protein n=1 Tax=Grifola frondosa TaxID=5627 RepID=A0A1C7MW91_GRIFR|nr:hypothetical protein A0H81_01147 [Grifola frondosa]
MPPNSPSPGSAQSKTGSDGSSSRMSEAALRKKKNADAQAAFRARRANYIATLEETVTNLEGVVLQLQDSYRQTKNDVTELRAENARMRAELEHRDRERAWNRKMWQEKSANMKMDPDLQSDEFPSVSPYASARPPSSAIGATMGSVTDYTQRSPASTLGYGVEDGSVDGRPMEPHSLARFDQYSSYSVDNSNRDGTWSQGVQVNDPGFDSGSSTHSPTYVESPNLTATDMVYPSRFAVVDDQKVPLTAINTAPYMYAPSRSLSPALSTPTSASSTSMTSAPYQFTFPEGTVLQERPEFNFRRHQVPELTLHGGTADISVLTSRSSDAAHYRMAGRSNPTSERSFVHAPSPYSNAENGMHDRESDSESGSYTYSTRPRRPPSRTSRSPSPGPPPICSTLAVIKAQAFGALRRTRTRSRKTSEGAARAAVEALEARGIGMGLRVGNATKRPRLHDSDGDAQT